MPALVMGPYRRLLAALAAAAGVAVQTPAWAAPPCPKDYAALKDREMAIIDAGSALEDIFDDPSRLTPAQLALVERADALLESRSRIADQRDIQIIDRARRLLGSERTWNRRDTRQCATGETRLSLFCALQVASREVTGEYRHRRTALQEVRFAVEAATQGRQYDHRLMEFNNDPRTRLSDIWAVLTAARARLVERLALQRACKL
jgi:hypothetical protein